MSSYRIFLSAFFLFLTSSSLPAQSVPWSAPLRGSWVQTGVATEEDVVLARNNTGIEIVVSAQENAAVHQSAEFLAGDIEKISDYRPPVVANESGKKGAVHLVTLGQGSLPEGIDTKTLEGKWESYEVWTDRGSIWLVGSNPRGTAFAAYTLSERLGIDPLYLWTGYAPVSHNPLVMKQTRFIQGPPTVKYRGWTC